MESDVAHLPVSDRLWAWFEANKKPALATTSVAVVAGLIIWFSVWRHGEQQADAGDALSQALAAQMENPGTRPDSADAFLKVAQTYRGTGAGAQALLLAASAFYTDNNYDKAREQFERFVREYQGSPLMGQALFGMGCCLDAQGKSDQAIAAYQKVIAAAPNENVVPQAKMALASLYEAQNKPDKARSLYEDVERSAPFTSLGNEAGMRLEELIARTPSLAPPPPPPTNAPFQLDLKK
jgi:TolA-binding protein